MRSLSSLDIHYLIRELQTLRGARVDTIYQLEKKDFLFQIHKSGEGRALVRAILPSFIYLTKEKPEMPQQPMPFGIYLRRLLEQGRILDVHMPPGERVITIDIQLKERIVSLHFELFSKGNIIVTSEGIILNALETSQGARVLTKNQPYTPTTTTHDLPSLPLLQLNQEISDGIALFLAKNCGLGRHYAEELCLRAGISAQKNSLTQEEHHTLVCAYQELYNQPTDAHASSTEATPFRLSRTPSESTRYPTYSEALEHIHSLETPKKIENTRLEQARKRQQTIIAKQEEDIATWEGQAALAQEKAQQIYLHYQKIQEILHAFAHERKKTDLSTLAKNISPHSIIQAIHPEKRIITIETDNL